MDIKQLETRIIRKAASAIIEAGYSIRVYDGEEFATEQTSKLSEVMAEVFATEETYFYAYQDGLCRGMVWFIHGNGCDVIADNSDSLEAVLKPAIELAEKLC